MWTVSDAFYIGMMLFKSCFKAILHFFLHRFSPKPVWSEEGYVGKQNTQFSCSVISCISIKAVKYCDNPWEGSGRCKYLIPGHVLPTVAHQKPKLSAAFGSGHCLGHAWFPCGRFAHAFPSSGNFLPCGSHSPTQWTAVKVLFKPHPFFYQLGLVLFLSQFLLPEECALMPLIDILVLFLLLKKRKTHPASSGTMSRAFSSFVYLGNRL